MIVLLKQPPHTLLLRADTGFRVNLSAYTNYKDEVENSLFFKLLTQNKAGVKSFQAINRGLKYFKKLLFVI